MGRAQVKDLNLVVNNSKLQKQFADMQGQRNPKQVQDMRAIQEHLPADFMKGLQRASLMKVVIIDNLAESFQLQPLNGIKIKDWFGNDFNDRELLALIPFLKSLPERLIPDVRVEVGKFRRNLFLPVSSKGNTVMLGHQTLGGMGGLQGLGIGLSST